MTLGKQDLSGKLTKPEQSVNCSEPTTRLTAKNIDLDIAESNSLSVEQPELDINSATADELIVHIMTKAAGTSSIYKYLAKLRKISPIYRMGELPVLFCTNYKYSDFVFRDHRFGKPSANDNHNLTAQMMSPAGLTESAMLKHSMLMKNPPDHTRLRSLVSKTFTPSRLNKLKPQIELITDDILNKVSDIKEVEVMEHIAFRLPVRIIGELIGMPPEDRDQFRYVVANSIAAMEPSATLEQIKNASQAMSTMELYMKEFIVEKKRHPGDDLCSELINAHVYKDKLNEDELIGTLVLLFAAGFETTTNLIGNGLYSLLSNIDQYESLKSNPSYIESAVEEMLRYESPVQLDARVAFEDCHIGDTAVKKHDTVVIFIGAANRDPLQFDNPDIFNVTRAPNNPLSFAAGIHHCLGANLSRLEGKIVFSNMLERFKDITLTDEKVVWRNSFILRGLKQLNVTFG